MEKQKPKMISVSEFAYRLGENTGIALTAQKHGDAVALGGGDALSIYLHKNFDLLATSLAGSPTDYEAYSESSKNIERKVQNWVDKGDELVNELTDLSDARAKLMKEFIVNFGRLNSAKIKQDRLLFRSNERSPLTNLLEYYELQIESDKGAHANKKFIDWILAESDNFKYQIDRRYEQQLLDQVANIKANRRGKVE